MQSFLPNEFQMAKQSGYSLVEIILVVVIVGVLAAAGLKYYVDIHEEAMKTSVESQARTFAAAIHAGRADWLLKKHQGDISTQPGNKMSVELDGMRIFVNEKGWPANVSTELDSSVETQTAAECHELWAGLMSHPVAATIEGVNEPGKGRQKYHVSHVDGACRYAMYGRFEGVYFFDYRPETGKVLSNLPAAQ